MRQHVLHVDTSTCRCVDALTILGNSQMGPEYMGRYIFFSNKNGTNQVAIAISIAIGFVFLLVCFSGGAAWGPWAQAPQEK